jgi:DNA-directed RNA polymerase specialized sigma24 family protein
MTENSGEGSFFSIFQRCKDGRESIDAILGQETFTNRLRDLVRNRDFGIFNGKYDRDDLYQDICLKFWEMESMLQISGNILTEKEFFDWLFVVVRNHYYSMIRKHIAQKRDGLRSDKPVEEFLTLAHEVDFEAEVFLSQFLKFTEKYPEEWQWAVDLWLNNFSYRDMEEILRGEGIQCTYGTIRNWVTSIIEDFKRSLESPMHKKLPKPVPRWLAS